MIIVIYKRIVVFGDYSNPWIIKQIGDINMYKEEFKDTNFTNSIIMIKSLVWPGAYIFYQGDRWFNFYVGYGHKADNTDYYPIMPQMPQPEPSDGPEQPEPNPKDEPTDEMKLKDPTFVQDFINKLEEIQNNPDRYTEVITAAFATIDTESAGNIDRKEIENLIKAFTDEAQITVGIDPSALEEFFKLFDKEEAGTITKEELEEPFKALITAWVTVLKEKLAEIS